MKSLVFLVLHNSYNCMVLQIGQIMGWLGSQLSATIVLSKKLSLQDEVLAHICYIGELQTQLQMWYAFLVVAQMYTDYF